jgi:hypothetical protein
MKSDKTRVALVNYKITAVKKFFYQSWAEKTLTEMRKKPIANFDLERKYRYCKGLGRARSLP